MNCSLVKLKTSYRAILASYEKITHLSLILIVHPLVCIKISSAYRIIKLAKRLEPHEVPIMITAYLQNPKNVPTALKLLERAIRCGDTFAAAVLLSSHDARLAKALKKDHQLLPTT